MTAVELALSFAQGHLILGLSQRSWDGRDDGESSHLGWPKAARFCKNYGPEVKALIVCKSEPKGFKMLDVGSVITGPATERSEVRRRCNC